MLKSQRKSRASAFDDVDVLDESPRSFFSRYLPIATAGLLVVLALVFSSNLISRNADATVNPEAISDTAMIAPTTDLEGKGSLLPADVSFTAVDLSALRRQTVMSDGKTDLTNLAPFSAGVSAPIPKAKPGNIASIVAAQRTIKIIPASYQSNSGDDVSPPAVKRLLLAPAMSSGPLVLVAPVVRPPASSAPATTTPFFAELRIKTAELTCLARAVYFEARSESELGQLAVAKVILNRVKDPDYPKTICGVVYQGSERRNSCQFSFACDGLAGVIRSPSSWARAKSIAERAVADDPSIRMLQATNYHADYVSPRWAKTLKRLVRIGHHIFYKPTNAG